MTEKSPDDFDVIVPRKRAENGGPGEVYRIRPSGVSIEQFLPAKEGQPVLPGAELVRVRRRGNLPIGDVETIYSARAADVEAPTSRSGPPAVVSDAYREGWEAIFGQGQEEAN